MLLFVVPMLFEHELMQQHSRLFRNIMNDGKILFRNCNKDFFRFSSFVI